MKYFLQLFLFFLVQPLSAQIEGNKCAVEILRKSILAMGGEKKISELGNLVLSGDGHSNYLEQSERYEGSYISKFTQSV